MPAAMVSAADASRHQVDELILDYLLWYCTSAMLTERRLRADGRATKTECAEASQSADMGLRLANTFLQTFKHLHPNHLSENVTLRLRVCRFTALLLRRLDVTVPSLDLPNAPPPQTDSSESFAQRRTRTWLSAKGIKNVLNEEFFAPPVTPFPLSSQHRNMESHLRDMGYPASRAVGSLWGDATLRDGLWEFMLITAHTSARHEEVSKLWIEIAVEFMLQALLEAYRCLGSTGVDAVNECFSYGLAESEDPMAQEIEEVVVNEMFAADDGAVGLEFEQFKNEVLAEIVPPAGVPLETHFDTLAQQNPWAKFENSMVNGYLRAVVESQSLPVLAQLEKGQLEGFDPADVRTMLARAGVEDDVWR